MSETVYKTSFLLPGDLSQAIAGQVAVCLQDGESMVYASSYFIDKSAAPPGWRIEWIGPRPFTAGDIVPQLALHGVAGGGLTDFSCEALPDINWLAHSYSQFQPFTVGRFFIYGSHYEGAVPEGLAGLQIDAATAFGSGEHGTTAGCLEALLYLSGKGVLSVKSLDMGTGSGILAIAAAKIWGASVMAVDNDAEATRVAARHRDVNAVSERLMPCHTGDGFNTPEVLRARPFDLVIANILAGPLKEMAPALAETLARGGYAVLSGLLTEQAEDVFDAYHAHGMEIDRRIDRGEWSTLVLLKS